MGTKRVGLARVEALIENLKRDLALGGAVLSGLNANIINVASATKALPGPKILFTGFIVFVPYVRAAIACAPPTK